MSNSAISILERLVGFNTVSTQSNLLLIDYAEDLLKKAGARCYRDYNSTCEKANLYAILGPDTEGGVILSGHTDVVPVKGQSWSTDPFILTEKSGRIYGRGSADMKGFLACCLGAIEEIKQAHLKHPFIFAFSYDEEFGCLGAPSMIAKIRNELPPARAAIIGEPSLMKTVNAHKGSIGKEARFQGYEVHSSLLPYGVSAVMAAGELIECFRIQNELNAINTNSQLLFDPPYTTLHTGVIRGGTANNITAKDCLLGIDIRVMPDEAAAKWEGWLKEKVDLIEARMKSIQPSCFVKLSEIGYVPPCRPEKNGEAEALIRRLTSDDSQNTVSFGTEAGQFQDEGFSAAICGPGSIEQAHKADEYIEITQIEAGSVFLSNLVKELSH